MSNVTTHSAQNFAQNILTWHDKHGRHDLPWQVRHPYVVWVSEIMLQQTQVKTVLGYFERFMLRFPTVQDLAAAEWDDVAELWAGLGYYARARNLHKAAKQLVTDYDPNSIDEFPQTLDEWQALSGIGQSTAGAIMAMGLGKYGVILDGNVKRVLTRYAAVSDDVTKAATLRTLWQLADELTPASDSPQYAQAIMDMGATLCTRSNPTCGSCPVQTDCQANALGTPTAFPVKKKKKKIPTKQAQVIIFQYIDNGEQQQLWIQRPDSGLWGGLWCYPIVSTDTDDTDDLPEDIRTLMRQCASSSFEPVKHTFSHFHWLLTPVVYELDTGMKHQLDALRLDGFVGTWLTLDESTQKGKPRAMHKVKEKISSG